MRTWILAIAMGCGAGAAAQPAGSEAVAEQVEPLLLGDKAPALRIGRWVKGESVNEFQAGRVYVVEFWATWCGPCVAGIPHLTELQKRFKEHADFVSVTREDENNSLDTVLDFVESQGEKMGYRVAFDAQGRTWAAYMEAAGQNGIPCAFVVDKQGLVAWVGHPADPRFEKTIEQIIADEFDIEAARNASAEQAARAGRVAKAQAELHAAWGAGDRERAFALADEIVAMDPAGMVRWAWWKFEALMLGEPERAYAYVRELRDGIYSENADMLLRLAYGIADSLGIESPDTGLALELAERAVELTGGQDSRMLAGLAMVHMNRKEYDEGIAAQQRAVDLATTPAMKQQLQNDLDFYILDKEYEEGG